MPNFLCIRSPSSNSWVRVGDRVEGYLSGEYLHVQTIIRNTFPQYVRSRYLARNFCSLDVGILTPTTYTWTDTVSRVFATADRATLRARPVTPERSLKAKVWPPVSKKKYGVSFKKVVVLR